MPRPFSQQLSGSGITVEPDLLAQEQRSSEQGLAGCSCRRSTCLRRQLISAKWMAASVMPVDGLRQFHSTFQLCEQRLLCRWCDEPEVLPSAKNCLAPLPRHPARYHPSAAFEHHPQDPAQMIRPSHVRHQSHRLACHCGGPVDLCREPDRGVSHDLVPVRLRSSFAQTYRQPQVSAFQKESSPHRN